MAYYFGKLSEWLKNEKMGDDLGESDVHNVK